eukprot:131793_1
MKNKRNIVYAVGINYNGGFGVGNNNDSTTISRLEWSNKINIIKIYNGYYFTIYKDDNNILYAAGDNTKGSCLQDKSKEKITTLMKVAGLPNIQISNVYCNPAWNSYHGFIVSKDNMIYAFGGNERGQLGIGNARNVYKVHGIKWKYDKIKQIQCAAYYSIILTNKGCVYSTDFSNSGGNAQKVYNSNGTKQWTEIKSLKNITNIAAGHQHTLCVNADGNIYAFGWNGKGALGLNKKDDKENHSNPTLIPFFSSQHIRIINVYCGSSHSLALSQTGTVYCWGDNLNGQCGHGYATKRDDPILEPKQIESLKNNKIKNIVTGYVHSAAITTTNKIFMFGRNGYNQCIIPTYNAAKDNPIEITQYIFLKFKKYIIDITLGQNNTKLILSDSQNNNLENEEKEFDEYKQTHQNDQINNNDINSSSVLAIVIPIICILICICICFVMVIIYYKKKKKYILDAFNKRTANTDIEMNDYGQSNFPDQMQNKLEGNKPVTYTLTEVPANSPTSVNNEFVIDNNSVMVSVGSVSPVSHISANNNGTDIVQFTNTAGGNDVNETNEYNVMDYNSYNNVNNNDNDIIHFANTAGGDHGNGMLNEQNNENNEQNANQYTFNNDDGDMKLSS